MHRSTPLRAALVTAVAAACIAQTEEGKKLTPRELFYLPVAGATSAAAQPPAEERVTPTPVAQPRRAVRKTPPAPHRETAQRPDLPSGAKVIAVSGAATRPLGLRYSLLRGNEDNEYREVSPDAVFRSGDKLRLSIESNDAGYLYVVMRGSSGAWRVLFPNKQINEGNNHIEPGRSYLVPPAPNRFFFDEHPGAEKLFLILSRRPESDLEKLIYQVDAPEEQAAPVARPTNVPPRRTLIAQNVTSIDDALVGRLRNQMVARDLVFEKVDENTPGEKKENAVYVVNTTRAPDARLQVDVTLIHQ